MDRPPAPMMQTPTGPVAARDVWVRVCELGMAGGVYEELARHWGVTPWDIGEAVIAWLDWDALHRPPAGAVDALEIGVYAELATRCMDAVRAGDWRAARAALDSTEALAASLRRVTGRGDGVVIDLRVNGRRVTHED